MIFRTAAGVVFALVLSLVLIVIAEASGARTLNGFDLDDATIPVKAIKQGGPQRDGIPAINQPKYLNAGEADFLDADGVHKAYPFEDTVNGRAVTIVWDGEHDSARAEGPDGAAIPTTTGFWFAWYAFYPDTLVFRGEDDER
ncbi:MAG TPA: hypothetical protein VJ883_01525 [Woeseiaceae bacterium]|nr:hypothetical protein [Woeseiaceae bacterium]